MTPTPPTETDPPRVALDPVGWVRRQEFLREPDLHRSDQAVRSLVDRLGRRGSGRELPGTDGEELLETLKITLQEALDLNRREAREAAGGSFEEAVTAL